MMRACSANTGEGTLWPVDAALRPEGKSGPLVRTIASHRTYYERWAKTWEFQALLKAWVSAGDLEVGKAYKDAIQPLVWEAAGRDHFVEDVQAMRRRVEQHVPAAEADRQLKLGRGGLRDVEFSVQLLQLVHGRGDPSLRSATTLEGLSALAQGRLHRPRGRADPGRGLPAAADSRAPDPALPPAPDAPHAHQRDRAAAPRPGHRAAGHPRQGGRRAASVPVPRGPPHPRAAVLPAAAQRRRQAQPQPTPR